MAIQVYDIHVSKREVAAAPARCPESVGRQIAEKIKQVATTRHVTGIDLLPIPQDGWYTTFRLSIETED